MKLPEVGTEVTVDGKQGWYQGWVAGCGGDLWWVMVDDKVRPFKAEEVKVVVDNDQPISRTRDDFEKLDIDKMPLEAARGVLGALCTHLRVNVEWRKEFYGGHDFRVVPMER